MYDGEDALAYLETDCYDVAILDIMMPKMDGITVLKKLRAGGSQIPVLMLTAKSEIEDRVLGLDSGASDATLVAQAFNSVFSVGNIGEKFVAIAMFLFAFTTVLGWSHYGTKAWEYLFGTKSTIVFKIIHIGTIILGAIMTSSLAWDISDTFNGLMMIPNLIGVVVLFPLVMKITKNYVDRKIRKKDVKPILSYDPELQKEAEDNLDT